MSLGQGGSFSRPFDDPFEFERGKDSRIRPPYETLVIYLLRMKWPAMSNAPYFGFEFGLTLVNIKDTGPVLSLDVVWQPKDEIEEDRMAFSHDGFLVVSVNDEGDVFAGDPFESMGYFVGSQDPWDASAEELKHQLWLSGSKERPVTASEGGVLTPTGS